MDRRDFLASLGLLGASVVGRKYFPGWSPTSSGLLTRHCSQVVLLSPEDTFTVNFDAHPDLAHTYVAVSDDGIAWRRVKSIRAADWTRIEYQPTSAQYVRVEYECR